MIKNQSEGGLKLRKYSEDVFNIQFNGYTNCGIFHEIIEKPIEKHQHSFLEIIYVVKGHAYQHINNSTFLVGKGDLLFVNYNSVHSFEPKGKFEYVNVGFKPEFLINKLNSYNVFPLVMLTDFEEIRANDERILTFYGNEQKEIESLFQIMLFEKNGTNTFKENILEYCLNILISLIVNKISIGNDKKKEWDELLEYINSNINKKITLKELATQCYYNPAYLSRVFKEKFSISPIQYILSKKIEKAKSMIIEGHTIEYIIEELNFSSRQFFYQTFKKFENISVTEFRKLEKID